MDIGRAKLLKTKDAVIILSEHRHALASKRRTEARAEYREKGTFQQQQAVRAAERGHGWEYIVEQTGIDDRLARLFVLGTD